MAGWRAEVRRERLATQRMLAAASPQPTMTDADVRQLINELGDIAAVLNEADPAAKAQVYADLGLQLVLDPLRKRVAVTATRVGISVSEGGLEPPRP